MSEVYKRSLAHATRKGKEALPENYDDPETDGIIVPENSPVLKGEKKRKKRTKGNFAKLEWFALRYLNDSERSVYAAMLYLGGWRGDSLVITNAQIKDLIRKSSSAIERAQDGLKRKGFIKREKSPLKLGARWRVNDTWEKIRACGDEKELLKMI